MNYITVKPRHKRKHADFFFPHIGNVLNEMMRTSVSDIVKADTDQLKNTIPAVNVIEYVDHYLLEMAIPGMSKKDIEINVAEDKLVISAENKGKNADKKYSLKEFYYNSFKRSFNISEGIDQEEIVASFKNGILSIKLGKKKEEIKKGPKKIKIS